VPTPKLEGFFSSESTPDRVVSIRCEPEIVYLEQARGRQCLNFDFLLTNLTDRELAVRFIKVAAYDKSGHLLTFRYVNRNAVGPSGLDTACVLSIPARETVDLYNPFVDFPCDLSIAELRYTFTFAESDGSREYYNGNVIVQPVIYEQQTPLQVPMRGLLTIIDGHDYLSHHRRFAMHLIRQVTKGAFACNFSRYGLDFAVIGEDGNLAQMKPAEYEANRDFHFTDIRKSYTDGALVYAPAAGKVVEAVSNLADLYDSTFDTDLAIQEGRMHEIAGNRITIQHTETEFSHLLHLEQNSLLVSEGDSVQVGQPVARIGFSGTATVYSHLHYQLMSGRDFLQSEALPVLFSDVTLVRGATHVHEETVSLETGDFLLA
jgi:murein DD-endopeptidase MepM/ murein hydrolase activator NlpD